MDALDVLLRVERQALDQERRELRGIDRALAAVADELAALRAVVAEERAADAGVGGTLVAYLARARAQERRLLERRAGLEDERAAAAERLAARHTASRRLEILTERRGRRRAAEASRHEQREIEDLHRQRRGAGAIRTRARGSP